MRFLSNTHDPEDPNMKQYIIAMTGETGEESFRHHMKWLSGKIIGEPKATEAYTVQQLTDMGIVGVYSPD